MSNAVRNALALLLIAFMVGIVAGGAGLLSSGSDATAGSLVPFDPSAPAEPKAKPTPTPKPKAAAPTPVGGGLTATAVHEGSGRIIISGVQRPADAGTRITVQRKESGRWADFPASSTVGSDGRYSLWLQTGHKGPMVFRVVDAKTGQASNPAPVTV